MMSEPRTTYERYFNNPLKYAQSLFSESNHDYDGMVDTITRNMNHYRLKSKHIELRSSVPDRAHIYIPSLSPAINTVTDIFMEMYRSGDPIIKAIGVYPNDYDPEMMKVLDASANRIENLVNANIRPDISNNAIDIENWFAGLCIFPYSICKIDMRYKDGEVEDYRPVFDGYDDLMRPKYRPELVSKKALALPYPKLSFKMPANCRLELYIPDRSMWSYFFDIEDLSDSQLVDLVESKDWNKRNLKKILRKQPADLAASAKHGAFGYDSYNTGRYSSSYGTDANVWGVGNYRHITGYIKVWNIQLGYSEIREIHFIEGAKNDIALLHEDSYGYGSDDLPYTVSCNYIIPGQVAGMSTADMGAPSQDAFNEGLNQVWDAGTRNLEPSMAIAEGSLIGKLRWGPRAINRFNTGGDSVGSKFAPMHLPVYSSSMIEMAGIMEQHGKIAMNAIDPISGQRESRERGEKKVGIEKMHLAAATRAISRMMSRHVDALEYAINLGWRMQKREINKHLEYDENMIIQLGGELKHDAVVTELAQLKPDLDLKLCVRLELENTKSFMNKEDRFASLIGISNFISANYPYLHNLNPKGMLELLRRVMEAGDVKNVNSILESDEKMNINNTKMEVPVG